MVQAVWPDGSPISGVEVIATTPGNLTFVLDFHSTGNPPPLTQNELEVLSEMQPLMGGMPLEVICDGKEDLDRFTQCAKLVIPAIASLGFEGEIVDDIRAALICACFNDRELSDEAKNLTPSTERLSLAFQSIIKCIDALP